MNCRFLVKAQSILPLTFIIRRPATPGSILDSLSMLSWTFQLGVLMPRFFTQYFGQSASSCPETSALLLRWEQPHCIDLDQWKGLQRPSEVFDAFDLSTMSQIVPVCSEHQRSIQKRTIGGTMPLQENRMKRTEQRFLLCRRICCRPNMSRSPPQPTAIPLFVVSSNCRERFEVKELQKVHELRPETRGLPIREILRRFGC